MNKSLIAAAAFAAVAAGFTGSANAGVIGAGLGGVHKAVAGDVTTVHYKKYDRRYRKDWRHRHHKHKVCTWRHGHKHCWWR
ncbi:MAG: hypothetical protein AB7S74_05610 [Hyphomicrobium sp.]